VLVRFHPGPFIVMVLKQQKITISNVQDPDKLVKIDEQEEQLFPLAKSQYKLWILNPRKDLSHGYDPWEQWYDKCFGMIVSARSEKDARIVAAEMGCEENYWYDKNGEDSPWLYPEYSTCEELKVPQHDYCIMQDIHYA
jgi:hypothetical protein